MPIAKRVNLEQSLWNRIDDFRFARRCRNDTAALKLLLEAGLRKGFGIAKGSFKELIDGARQKLEAARAIEPATAQRQTCAKRFMIDEKLNAFITKFRDLIFRGESENATLCMLLQLGLEAETNEIGTDRELLFWEAHFRMYLAFYMQATPFLRAVVVMLAADNPEALLATVDKVFDADGRLL